MYDPDPRTAWQQWVRAMDRWDQRWAQTPPEAQHALLAEDPDYPDQCRGMTCGARTRKGTPCKRRDLYHSGRCHLHGGASTGPTTVEGKRRSAMNGLRPKRQRTP
jgi:hypothetical protein